MTRRVLLACVVALVVTFSLFFLMQSLIAMGEAALGDPLGGRVIDFVRLKRTQPLQLKKRQLPERAAPKPQPEAPSFDLPSGQGGASGAVVTPVSLPPIEKAVDLSGGPHLGAAQSDSDVVPLVRVNPIYPRNAAARGIEGWVRVEFSISVTGAVKNPRILASDPPEIFDRAAIRTIRKWKYRPKVENGVAVERHNVSVQLQFELEDEQP